MGAILGLFFSFVFWMYQGFVWYWALLLGFGWAVAITVSASLLNLLFSFASWGLRDVYEKFTERRNPSAETRPLVTDASAPVDRNEPQLMGVLVSSRLKSVAELAATLRSQTDEEWLRAAIEEALRKQEMLPPDLPGSVP